MTGVARGRWMAVAALVAAASVSACTTATHHASGVTRPATFRPNALNGTIRGYDQACSGLPTPVPVPATVRVMRENSVIASVAVTASETTDGQYRVTIPPGRYRVTATNWPKVSHSVVVTPGAQAIVNFPNVCE